MKVSLSRENSKPRNDCSSEAGYTVERRVFDETVKSRNVRLSDNEVLFLWFFIEKKRVFVCVCVFWHQNVCGVVLEKWSFLYHVTIPNDCSFVGSRIYNRRVFDETVKCLFLLF